MTDEPRSRAAGFAVVVVVTVVVAAVLSVLRLPSPALFASLVGGMAHALTSSTDLRVPSWTFRLGQALIGATIGAVVSAQALRGMLEDAVPIVLVTVGTVLVSLAAGWVMAQRGDVSRVTGTFAMIAGGASGVVAVARDLGADERVVTVVQYLRVLVVLVTLPVVTALVFRPDDGRGSLATGNAGLPADLVFVAAAVAGGLLLARVARIATATLLGALAVAVVLAAGGWLGDVAVPAPVQWVAFALIGAQVGLRFTRESLAAITRMLPAVLAIIIVMIVVTAAMGVVLALLTPVDALTAYLATTPGGLFAVLATAADTGSDVTFVMALQLFRLLVILLCLPLLARWAGTWRDRPGDEGTS